MILLNKGSNWIYLCFVIVFLFPEKALSQTNHPRLVCKEDFELIPIKGTLYQYNFTESIFQYEIVQWNQYPLGICKEKGIPEERVMTDKQWEWTLEAIERINSEWFLFQVNKVTHKFGDEGIYWRIEGVPKTLFKWGCNEDKYNVVYISKNRIKNNPLGMMTSMDTMWDGRQFYYTVEMGIYKERWHL